MSLPLAKRRGAGDTNLPKSDSIYKCMEVATTAPAATYFYNQFEQKLSDSGLKESSSAILTEVEKFADLMSLSSASGDQAWSGQIQVASRFQRYQEHLAKEAVRQVDVHEITFDYAISDESEFIRGYSSDDQPLDTNQLNAMDNIFNAWLVENNMLCKNGVVYEATEQGEIKHDDRNQPVKADSERLNNLIQDGSKGFGQYLQKKNDSIDLTIREQAYPTQQVEAGYTA